MSTPHPPRAPRAQRSEFDTFYRLQTRWMDNDIYGHMNNVVHYSLFDTAVNGWLIEQGLLDPRHGETYGLVVETGCRYHAEIAFPAWIEAGLRIGSLGKSSVRYEIGLFAEGHEQALAEGFFVHVNVTRATHRPTPLDARWRTVLERLVPAGPG
ncbi:MAG: acyl-CoA thioesterase [Pararhodobacter sp.]